jgi:hypothetical protein
MKHLVHVRMLPRGGRLLPGGASGRSRTSSHVTSLSRYNNRPQARDGTCSKTCVLVIYPIYGVLQHGIPTGERRSVEVLNG